jgi:hypothetical protein
MALVTLAQAKAHLKFFTASVSPATEEESDLLLKMAQAEALILDYLGYSEASPPIWDEDTVPLVVHTAILYQLGELWRFRGDDPGDEGPNATDGYLSPWVTNALRRFRPPSLA